jgi:hypothetical protein
MCVSKCVMKFQETRGVCDDDVWVAKIQCMIGTNIKAMYAWQLHNLCRALKAHRGGVEEFHNARPEDATRFGGFECWKGARKKEAK